MYDAKGNRICRLSYNLHGISREFFRTKLPRSIFFNDIEIVVGRFICRSGLL